ncbi:MAG: hypothetical protein FWG83_07790, partial [Oscillospiraceae bacterium]|nr:hypothetical protein [Oscillospiraceae bacterium]
MNLSNTDERLNCLTRKELAPGIFLNIITDRRFKQNRVSVSFLTQLDSERASLNAVIPKILTNSCKEYPDIRALNAKLSSLYAARLSGGTGNLGDTQYVEIAIKTIDSRYSLESEDVMGEGLEILLQSIFNPLLEGNGFKSNVTETEKQACIDKIESELNEKRVYALRQASRLLCQGEPAAVFDHGTVEGVKAVTPESAYEAYQHLLKTARIEIMCVGCNDFIKRKKIFRGRF